MKFLYKCKFGKVPKKLDENEDSDVRQERQRIEALSKVNKLNEEAIAVIDLTKCFKRLINLNNYNYSKKAVSFNLKFNSMNLLIG